MSLMSKYQGFTVLTEKLEAGETYISEEHGVRMTVPAKDGVDTKPSAGPVLLERTTRIVECDGKSFFISSVVHCFPSGAVFPQPLVLEFSTEEVGAESSVTTRKYKVLLRMSSRT